VLESLQIAVYRRLPPALQVTASRLATPNFTVGAIALITTDGSDLLLVRPTYRRGWLPPGGFLSKGEEPIETLRREIEEELGVRMDFEPAHRVAFDVHRQGITFVFAGRAPEGVRFAVRSQELRAVQWFPLDDLPPLPNDFFEGLPDEDLQAVRSLGARRLAGQDFPPR
jgi:ADP-ribose pyrophosphatase YjhB (NUDIX family)